MSEPAKGASAEQEALRAEVSRLSNFVDWLNSKLEGLNEAHVRLDSHVHCTGPRFCMPEKWNAEDGTPDELLAALDMLFECQPAIYATATSRVALLMSLLTVKAQEWAAALYYQRSPVCNDYTLFIKELRNTFVPPSSDVEAEIQLLCLRQNHRPVHKYAADFRTIAAKLSCGDYALRSLFLIYKLRNII